MYLLWLIISGKSNYTILLHPSRATQGCRTSPQLTALLSGSRFLLDQYLLNKQQGWASLFRGLVCPPGRMARKELQCFSLSPGPSCTRHAHMREMCPFSPAFFQRHSFRSHLENALASLLGMVIRLAEGSRYMFSSG